MGMNEDIALYGVYGLTMYGDLVRVPIFTTDDYNHYTHQLHHYIKQQDYKKNREWFEERGIKQKLILLPIWLHMLVHNSPGSMVLSDEDFKKKIKINRYDLLFNRKKWRDNYYAKV